MNKGWDIFGIVIIPISKQGAVFDIKGAQKREISNFQLFYILYNFDAGFFFLVELIAQRATGSMSPYFLHILLFYSFRDKLDGKVPTKVEFQMLISYNFNAVIC
jgi:hypothetical protein